MPQNLLQSLRTSTGPGRFNMFPIAVSSEPDGEAPVDSRGVPQRVPVKFRIGRRAQDGFLTQWSGTSQIAVVQLDQDHSNLTQIAIVLAHHGPPIIPEDLKKEYKWQACPLHRRKRGDLQFRIGATIARTLAHPLPLGVWDGVVCLETKPNPNCCLIALEASTLVVRKVEPPRHSQIVGPDGLPFSERPLPEIVLP